VCVFVDHWSLHVWAAIGLDTVPLATLEGDSLFLNKESWPFLNFVSVDPKPTNRLYHGETFTNGERPRRVPSSVFFAGVLFIWQKSSGCSVAALYQVYIYCLLELCTKCLSVVSSCKVSVLYYKGRVSIISS